APGLCAARLIANGDEQRRHVFAMLLPRRLRKRRTRAMRLNALWREIDTHRVGIGIRSLHPPLRARFGNLHVLDHAPPRIIEAAQERPGSSQTPESAVAER